MRAGETLLKSKIHEFLEVKLAKLVPGTDGSVAEKVFTIYALFQAGIPPCNLTNRLVAKSILAGLWNPVPLFSDAPENSGITTLSIQCEFRRQLLDYIESLVPEELAAGKKDVFKRAHDKIQEIENQFPATNLRARGVSAVGLIFMGLIGLGLYLNNCLVEGKMTTTGSLWGILGALMVLGGSISGTHTLQVSCRQKRALKLFENFETTESTALLFQGSIQAETFNVDLFSEERLIRVAVGKIAEAYTNEDVTSKPAQILAYSF